MKKIFSNFIKSSICLSLVLVMICATACSNGSSTAKSVQSTKSSGNSSSITMKLSIADSTSSVFYTAAKRFKDEVEKNSNGNIKIQIFPSGQLGTLSEVTQGVQMGNIDLAAVASSVLGNFCSDVSVFDMPFLINSYQQAYRALDGAVGQHLNNEMEQKGIKCLGWWSMGFRNITTNKKITSIHELNNLRIRIMSSNIYQDTFTALGCEPVQMNWSETFTALQQGTVDAQENPYTQILDSSIYEVNKYVIETQHAFGPAAFIIAPKTWSKLSADQQKIIIDATESATNLERTECEKQNAAAKKELVSKHGMQVISIDRSKLKNAVQSVYNKHSELADLVKQCNSYAK